MAEQKSPDELRKEAEILNQQATELEELAQEPPFREEKKDKPPKATDKEIRDDEEVGKRGRFQFGAGDSKIIGQLFMAVGISVLLSFFLVGQFMVSKSDFETNMNAMNATVTSATNQMNQTVDSLNTTVSGLSSAIPSQVNSAVATALAGFSGQLTTISGQITDLSARLTTSETNIADLLAKVTALEAKVIELEEDIATSTTTADGTTTGDVTLAVSYASHDQIFGGGNFEYYLQITNSSGTLKKVFIQATVTLSPNIPSPTYTLNEVDTKFTSSSVLSEEEYVEIFSPSSIIAVSEGYVVMGQTTIQVPVTFELVYTDGTAMWNVTFTPVVTSY